MLVQGDETGDVPLCEHVREYLRERYAKPGNVFCGVTHRLDRPVSGVVVFAKTSKALERLNKAFQEGQIQKRYVCVVEGRPEPMMGRLRHFLTKDHERNIVKASASQRYASSKEAVLDYKLLAHLGGHSLLEVLPRTGRPHQIRVQLSKINCPIRGDVKYGASKLNENPTMIHLHGFQLSLTHPVRQEQMTFTAQPPQEQLWDLFRQALPDPDSPIRSTEFEEE